LPGTIQVRLVSHARALNLVVCAGRKRTLERESGGSRFSPVRTIGDHGAQVRMLQHAPRFREALDILIAAKRISQRLQETIAQFVTPLDRTPTASSSSSRS
jgi:hypothetical protein